MIKKSVQFAPRLLQEDEVVYVVAFCWFVSLTYIHNYTANVAHFLGRGWYTWGSISKTDFYQLVIPVLFASALVIKEIDYNGRGHPYNHGLGLFEQHFLRLWTLPLYLLTGQRIEG